MKLEDLKLGDRVEVFKPHTSIADMKGQATIVGIDASDPDLSVMIAWNPGDITSVRKCHDTWIAEPGATFLPNASDLFQVSLWINPKFITAKLAGDVATPKPTNGVVASVPCRQCQRSNDAGATKCWWCEISNPTIR